MAVRYTHLAIVRCRLSEVIILLALGEIVSALEGLDTPGTRIFTSGMAAITCTLLSALGL
jgi:hypothetical protein